ncbi:hypothetical protein [Vibrio phage vB_VhaP_PG11]|nr:hypothetical protein [Vibrio phage vB_VhaP_PG11]
MDIPFEFVVVGTQKGGAYPLYRWKVCSMPIPTQRVLPV